MCEHELSTASAAAGHAQERNENNHDTSRSPVELSSEKPLEIRHDTPSLPVDANFVDEIKILRGVCIDEKANEHDCPEAKHSLPCIRCPVFSPQADSAQKQLSTTKVDTECYSPVANLHSRQLDILYTLPWADSIVLGSSSLDVSVSTFRTKFIPLIYATHQ